MAQKIGLALAGGGARASAHIGVLQALNEHDIFPDEISGASAGAMIGALYCHGYSPLEILELSMQEEFVRIFKFQLLTREWNRLSMLKRLLQKHLPENSFEAMKIPLHVCVTNLNKGVSEYLKDGDLTTSIIASCAVPVIFKPVIFNNTTYVDGGVLNNLPVEPLMNRGMKTMGVSICPHEELETIKGIREISERVFQLNVWSNTEHRLRQCDVALEVEDSFTYGMFDVKKSEELFKIGYDCAMKQMPQIIEGLS
ncbi:NTE family protein [Nonlabens sp. Hel1_33_55]|uniref:patatin-like phospholipase family protein n=1 Tax=Nonlabens sp. Hel1_33_55 TaxID=1336802 RepID=UPI000875D293|nr:patatin-like phospholipase family protein [Nonlabens sp. Hel1_33_55]SCY18190.1 NTE family protein [Nonlabens sp. Hel1_33_55]